MTEPVLRDAWNTWEVVPGDQALAHDNQFAAILSVSNKVAPRLAVAETWDGLIDRLCEVDPGRTLQVTLFLPDSWRAEQDPLSAPRRVPADVWNLARLNRSADHLLALHSMRRHNDGSKDTGCAICIDEPSPCFTVREVQAARGMCWISQDAGPAGAWRAMTEPELLFSAKIHDETGRFWCPGLGDLPAGYDSDHQRARRRRPPGWYVDPPPPTATADHR